jgi:hypothetical protein
MFKLSVLLYYLFCIGYTVFVIRKKKENGLIKALMITFLPGLGYVLALYLFKPRKYSSSHEEQDAINELGIEKSQDNFNFLQPVDIESEINVVPIQDALLLNNNKIKRKLLIHSLKENSIQNTKVLESALKNEDSETSHYAASAIMEMKRKLVNSIQELAEQLKENENDVSIMSTYSEVINRYLKSGFLDEGAYKQYLSLLSEVLEKIIASGQGKRQHYIDKINCDLDLLKFEAAAYHSDMFMEKHPNDETAYIMAMKLHYTLQNPIDLQKAMTTLKNQPVRLSAQGLSIIRFWM